LFVLWISCEVSLLKLRHIVMTDYIQSIEPDVDETKACWRVRYDLKKCILDSDCILKDKRSVRECFTDPTANVPHHCKSLQYTYQQCRRSMLDMRSRFRGRKGDMG